MKCKWPLNHVSISTTGKIRPCCGWQEQDDQPNYSDTTLTEYAESEFLTTLVSKLKQGEFGSGCQECQMDQELGHKGIMFNGHRRYHQTEKFSPVDAEIKFGNLCNAGCIMCSEYNSSLLEQENRQHPELSKFRSIQQRSFNNWYDDPEKFSQLAKDVSGYQKIRFTGGEPTVRGLLTNFLIEVARHNTDIKIQITTNGGKITEKLMNVLQQFRETEFNISIDGYAEANDFIRWPIRWQSINHSVDQIKTLPNNKIVVETSLQVCSLDRLAELIGWCEQRELRWNYNAVYGPDYLQPCIASDRVKEKVSRIPGLDIRRYLEYNSQDEDVNLLRTKCVDYLDTLDRVRGTDWRSVIEI
jgi:MoaA/NifB/PqqE/SkfB family radical SAM enzyme